MNLKKENRVFFAIACYGTVFGLLLAINPMLAFSLLAIAALAFAFFEPEKGLFLAIFYMSFEGVAKRASPTAFVYLLKDFLFIAILLGAIYKYRKKGLTVKSIPHSSLITLFALVIVLQLFNPLNQLSMVGRLSGARHFLLYFPAYFAGFILIREKLMLKKIAYLIIAMSILVSAIGVAGYFFDFGEMAVGQGTLFQSVGTAKVSSTLSDSPSFSYSLAFVSILLLAMVSMKKPLHFSYLLALPLFFAGMLISLDRIAWVAFFIGVFILSLLKNKKMMLLAIVLFGLAVLPFAANTDIANRVVSLSNPLGSYSMQVRIGNAMQIFYDPIAILFGKGLQVKGGALLEPEGGYYPGAEFNFVGMIYQLGLVGFTVFVLLILNIARLLWHNIQNCKDNFLKGMGIVALAQVAAAMTMFGGGGFFYWMPIGFYTWLFIGATTKLNKIKVEDKDSKPIAKNKKLLKRESSH